MMTGGVLAFLFCRYLKLHVHLADRDLVRGWAPDSARSAAASSRTLSLWGCRR